MPTFHGKTDKLELFEDLFQTSLKIHNQLTEDDRITYFHSLMRGDALQTFKSINGPTRENLEEILVSLLVSSSFRLVATSGIRNSSVATSSTSFNSVSTTSGIRNSSVATSSTSFNSVSRAQIRSEYGATPYSP